MLDIYRPLAEQHHRIITNRNNVVYRQASKTLPTSSMRFLNIGVMATLVTTALAAALNSEVSTDAKSVSPQLTTRSPNKYLKFSVVFDKTSTTDQIDFFIDKFSDLHHKDFEFLVWSSDPEDMHTRVVKMWKSKTNEYPNEASLYESWLTTPQGEETGISIVQSATVIRSARPAA